MSERINVVERYLLSKGLNNSPDKELILLKLQEVGEEGFMLNMFLQEEKKIPSINEIATWIKEGKFKACMNFDPKRYRELEAYEKGIKAEALYFNEK